MKYQKQELIRIYKNGKHGLITHSELIPIKEKLLLAINNLDVTFIPYLNNLISVLFLLLKENKLDFFDINFLNFAKINYDYNYFAIILYGLTYDESRISDNPLENELLFLNILSLYEGIYDILENDINNINYLIKTNQNLANIMVYYIKLRNEIINSNELNLDNKMVLSTILNHISTFIYINKQDYQNDFSLIERTIQHIKDNIEIFRLYFINNHIFDSECFIGSISSGGIKQEIYVIGDIVNNIYNNKIIVKKRQ